jgi:hypothetical protein
MIERGLEDLAWFEVGRLERKLEDLVFEIE